MFEAICMSSRAFRFCSIFFFNDSLAFNSIWFTVRMNKSNSGSFTIHQSSLLFGLGSSLLAYRHHISAVDWLCASYMIMIDPAQFLSRFEIDTWVWGWGEIFRIFMILTKLRLRPSLDWKIINLGDEKKERLHANWSYFIAFIYLRRNKYNNTRRSIRSCVMFG